MIWYHEVVRKYAVFGGRARRMEYWFFNLINLVIVILLAFIDWTAGWVFISSAGERYGTLTSVYNIAILIPALAVTIRRLHDTGRSGWWVLINFIPLIGLILIIVFLAEKGEHGVNEYGPDPKM